MVTCVIGTPLHQKTIMVAFLYSARISAQSFIKRNCHNSGTSDDIDMKLGRVTKLQKTQTSNLKLQTSKLNNIKKN